MKIQNEDFIVCCRVGISKKALVDGAVKEKCSICNNEIWVSPATLESIRLGLYKGKFACINCMNIKLDDETDKKINETTIRLTREDRKFIKKTYLGDKK